MLSISGELIVSRYVSESVTTDAGCFGHIGLSTGYKTVLYAVDKELHMWPKCPASVVIDSATYLLTISLH